MVPSHFNGKIWPHSTELWLGFLFVSYFILGHPVYGLKHDYKNVSRGFRPILRSSAAHDVAHVAHVAYVAHVAAHVVAPKITFIQRTYKDIQSSRERSTL